MNEHTPLEHRGTGMKANLLALAVIGFVLLLLALILLPSLGRARENAGGRSYCPANIRSVVQSMIVYSAENSNVFPVLPGPPPGSPYRQFTTVAAGTSSDVTLTNMYQDGSGMNGDITGCLWILVLKQQTTPKQYICKSDPWANSVASPVTSGGNFYSNFTTPPGAKDATSAISYSIAYPWTTTGRVGPWWRNTSDSSLPIMSDMAPMEGTGSPARTLGAPKPAKPAMWNSANHSGDGQTVGYADAHATFERTPIVGQNNDNIFTASRTGRPQQFGGVPVTASFSGVVVPADATVLNYDGPYDTVMLPARNCSTGGM